MPSLGEFELIARFFTRPAADASFVRQGVGDDCAILACGDSDLAVTTDMLVEGTHFFTDADPRALGHKALAVNLSDLAAAGATPACFFLSIALPRASESWLAEFSAGLLALADEHRCPLVGGDTTRGAIVAGAPGPLNLCITAMGRMPKGQALSRAHAVAGDDVWVSGELGGAALALAARRREVELASEHSTACFERMDRPQPRVALGQALRGVAHAAIDVSDGLLADLGHVLERSEVGATVQWDAVPRGAALRAQTSIRERACALAGGDDYELLFTAPAAARGAVEAAARSARTPVARIGAITTARECIVLDGSGERIELRRLGYEHFE
jgi:thiamine-monophosphate kinase